MMRRVMIPVLATLVLAGCSLWEDDEEVRLAGTRLSVIQDNPDLAADPRVADLRIVLPEPVINDAWPQPGGAPGHANQHVALADLPERVWRVDIGSGTGGDVVLLASPVAADGLIYTMDSETRVRAWEIDSGREVWSVDLYDEEEEDGGELGGGLAWSAGRLFATTGFASVIALDAATGNELWRERIAGPMRAGPAAADGVVYALTVDNRLYAMSADDGTPLWDHTGIAEVAGILGGATPAIENDVVVVPHTSGEIFALRTDSGRVLWSDTISAVRRLDSVSRLAHIRGHPVIDRGMVFAVSHSGRTVAIDLRTGERVWDKQLGGIQTPWIAGNYVFILTGDGILLALGRTTGRIHWAQYLQRWEDEDDLEDPVVWTGPVLASDRLIVAGSHGEALAISPYTGDILGRIELPDRVLIAPIVVDGTLFFLTDDADLVAYR